MSVVPTSGFNVDLFLMFVPQSREPKGKEAITQPGGDMEAVSLSHTYEEIVLEGMATSTSEYRCKDNFANCSYLSI